MLHPPIAEPSPTAIIIPPTPIPPTATVPVLRTHVVQAGETLLGLALAYDVPMAALQLQNHLGDGVTVQAGQTLTIPPSAMWAGASPFWVVHLVQPGETLYGIAEDWGCDVGTLQRVNGLGDADLLSVGQALILPLDTLAEAPAPTRPPHPTATVAPPVEVAPTPRGTIAPPADTLPPPATSAPTVAAPPADVAGMPAEIFRLINEQRALYGLPPYRYDSRLAQAAQAHADDCHQRGWCSHTGSDGSTMKERILRSGYEAVHWSECWAWYRSPQAAVAAWMNESPPNDPHRRTILSTWLTDVGVGVALGNDHGYYFVADFGSVQ